VSERRRTGGFATTEDLNGERATLVDALSSLRFASSRYY